MKFILVCVIVDLPDNLTETRIVKNSNETSVGANYKLHTRRVIKEICCFFARISFTICISVRLSDPQPPDHHSNALSTEPSHYLFGCVNH